MYILYLRNYELLTPGGLIGVSDNIVVDLLGLYETVVLLNYRAGS